MQVQAGDNSCEGCKMWLVSGKILVVFDILESELLRMTPGFLLNNWKSCSSNNCNWEDCVDGVVKTKFGFRCETLSNILDVQIEVSRKELNTHIWRFWERFVLEKYTWESQANS